MTELNKVAVLEVMSKYKDRIDILQGGEHGRTALHLAAIYDHEECARILVSAKFLTVLVTCYMDYMEILLMLQLHHFKNYIFV